VKGVQKLIVQAKAALKIAGGLFANKKPRWAKEEEAARSIMWSEAARFPPGFDKPKPDVGG